MLDTSPNKPYFVRKRAVSPDKTTGSKKLASSMSPHRRVNMRSELIDQLKKRQDLVDSGAIGKEMFDELQLTIFTDIKNQGCNYFSQVIDSRCYIQAVDS